MIMDEEIRDVGIFVVGSEIKRVWIIYRGRGDITKEVRKVVMYLKKMETLEYRWMMIEGELETMEPFNRFGSAYSSMRKWSCDC